MDRVLHADWNLEQDRAMKFLGLDAADGSIVAFVLHCTEETDLLCANGGSAQSSDPLSDRIECGSRCFVDARYAYCDALGARDGDSWLRAILQYVA